VVQDVDTETVARSTRYTAVGQVVTQGTRFLTNVALARILTPKDFGVVAVAILIASLLDVFKDMGTGSALIQRRTLDQALLNSVFYLNVALGLLASVVLVLLADPLATALGNTGASDVVRAYGGITLITTLAQIHHSLLRRHMRFREVATTAAVTAIVTAAVSMAAALLGLNYWALVIGTAVGAIVQTVMVWIYDPWRPTLTVSLASLRSIWWFSSHLFLSNMVFFVWTQVDKVIVSRFVGDVGLGVYTLGNRVVTAPLAALSTVIDEVTFPAFSNRQNDNAALRSGFTRSSAAIALVTFPLMAGLAVVAAPLVAVVFGPKWASLTPLIWALAPAGAAQSVTFNCGHLLLAKGRSDWTLRCGLLYLVVLGILELVMVRWGTVGVALGYTVGTIILAPFILALSFSLIELRLRDYLRVLWPYAWMTLLMSAIVAGVRWTCIEHEVGQPLELAACIATGLLVYAGLLRLTRPPAYFDLIGTIRGRLR
jgi:PST family polysaccharide transporter